ncbi:phage terminase large subunit [Variovorax sp. E3]|uniref:phage terminase large subunit n=1 Tax=Variovorax sp. E3 TaxID=1914993 RepID=UPI0018DAF787|nr:phage terminase large subunit [Variovorax sp. E3]
MAKAQRNLKGAEFLEELREFAEGQRTLIEAECDGFATNPAARLERIASARDDYELFCRAYFPHYVKPALSEFHSWFYQAFPKLVDMAQGQYANVSAPRGEAKSTLGTQLGTLWLIVTGRKHLIPIIMDSRDQAATMLEAIKVELECNPRLQMDYPDICGAGRVWRAGVIITRNNIKVQAFGALSRMRGLRHGPHRPDFVWLDDIENDENVRSKEQRDKREAWIKKVVLPLGPPDGSMDVFYLNTILHYDSVANRIHRSPQWRTRKKFKSVIRWPDRMDLWQQWEELYVNQEADASADASAESEADVFYREHQAEMDEGAIVSWPGMRPLIRCMQIRAGDHHAFDCEYQNDPTNDDASFFNCMTYWVQPCRDWVFYGSHDPSLGRFNSNRRDPAATLVGGFDREHGVLDVVEAIVVRRIPDKQISDIIRLQKEYNCLAWAFEAVQFQEFMRGTLVTRSAAEGVPVPALPVIPHTDKDLRIESLSPHVYNKLIRFYQAHSVLNSQLRHWPEADHDDGPDALEMLWKLAVSRAGGISIPRIGKRK